MSGFESGSGGSDRAELSFALAVALALGLDLALGAERGDTGESGTEFFEVDGAFEVLGGGGDALVSELLLDGAKVVRCGPDVFGDGAAEIVNVKIFADAETLLEGAPLLGEACLLAGLVSSGIVSAEDVHDGRGRLRVFRECGEDFGDLGRHGQSLVDTSLGEERECVGAGVVVAGADARGGAVADSEIGAEQQEETQRGIGVGEHEAAFVVGGNDGAGGRLAEARDGVGDCGASPGCLFEPAEKTAEALGVVRAGVIGERGVSVARTCAAGSPVVGRSLHVVSAELGGQFVAAVPQERAERGRRVRIAGLRCQPLLSGLGDGRG